MILTKSFGSVFSTFWISMCQELDVMFLTKGYKLLKDTIQNMLHEWQVPSLPVSVFSWIEYTCKCVSMEEMMTGVFIQFFIEDLSIKDSKIELDKKFHLFFFHRDIHISNSV